MSNELKSHVLTYGPANILAAYTDEFERDQFQAHLRIAADARPKKPCDPEYVSRRLAEEHWGSRFIYARPGVSVQLGNSLMVENELRFIEQETYERYQPPNPSDAVALITFTVPSDP